MTMTNCLNYSTAIANAISTIIIIIRIMLMIMIMIMLMIMIIKGDRLRRVPRGEYDQLGGFKLVPQFQPWNGGLIIIIIIKIIIIIIIIIMILTIITIDNDSDDARRGWRRWTWRRMFVAAGTSVFTSSLTNSRCC